MKPTLIDCHIAITSAVAVLAKALTDDAIAVSLHTDEHRMELLISQIDRIRGCFVRLLKEVRS